MITPELPTLREGDNGEAVRLVEQLLSSLYSFGQPPSSPSLVSTLVNFDAQYDSQTAQIIREFQEKYNTTFPAPAPNTKVDGIVGTQTWKALGDSIFRYAFSFRAQKMAMPELPTLREGDNGEAVRLLQQLLFSLYSFGQKQPTTRLVSTEVNFNAQYDSQTAQIIREFQEKYNTTFPAPAPKIKVDGIVGTQTWKALADSIFRYTFGRPST